MKIYGLTLEGNATIRNTRIDSGNTLPTTPTDGLLYYLKQQDGSYFPGLYLYSQSIGWVTGDITKVIAGTGLSGGGSSGDVTLQLSASGVTAGTYQEVTVDQYGRVTNGGMVSAYGKLAVTSKTSNYTIQVADCVVISTASQNVTFTLPNAQQAYSNSTSNVYYIKNSSNHNLYLSSAELIDGSSQILITKYTTLQVVTNGTTWFII